MIFHFSAAEEAMTSCRERREEGGPGGRQRPKGRGEHNIGDDTEQTEKTVEKEREKKTK